MLNLSLKLHHWAGETAAALRELHLYRYLIFVENSSKGEDCVHALRTKEQFCIEEEIDVLEEIVERLQVLIGELNARRKAGCGS